MSLEDEKPKSRSSVNRRIDPALRLEPLPGGRNFKDLKDGTSILLALIIFYRSNFSGDSSSQSLSPYFIVDFGRCVR